MSLIDAAKLRLAQADQRKTAEDLAAKAAYQVRYKAACDKIAEIVAGLGTIPGYNIERKENSFVIVPAAGGSPVAGGWGLFHERLRYYNDDSAYPSGEYYFNANYCVYDENGVHLCDTSSPNAFADALVKRLNL